MGSTLSYPTLALPLKRGGENREEKRMEKMQGKMVRHAHFFLAEVGFFGLGTSPDGA
jgi:hypothetical protein